MGCWGMGMTQSDEFCEVYDQFLAAYDEGEPPAEIAERILQQYRQEFSDDDGIMHDVYFALAKGQWMCCAFSNGLFARVEKIILSGDNLAFYRDLGASDSDLKVRKRNLDKFLQSLRTPRSAPRKRKPAPKYVFAEAKRGMVFWYRSKGRVYGAVVLDVLGKNSILVALSCELDSVPKDAGPILDAQAYTAAWFGALLAPGRVHSVGMVETVGDYNGRAGMYQSEDIHFCENFGMDYQWNHDKRAWDCGNMKMRDLLDAAHLPSEFRHRDRLDALMESQRKIIWVTD